MVGDYINAIKTLIDNALIANKHNFNYKFTIVNKEKLLIGNLSLFKCLGISAKLSRNQK